MKNILCYGDSNTFGFNPVDGSRYKKQERWTGVLAEILGSKYNVFEQGCNNRTMYFENPAGFEQSGCEYFEECLKKYIELEWVILALGINDTQFLYKADENTFKKGLSMLIAIRFMPLLFEESSKIITAQKLRGVWITDVTFKEKLKFIFNLDSFIVPLFVRVFHYAEQLSITALYRQNIGAVLTLNKINMKDISFLFIFAAAIWGIYAGTIIL